MTRALMFQGTGSDVGKTVLVAGLCRAAKLRGIKVAPFKPQNMSNNAAVAEPEPDGSGGGEIGRGQWLQALACGVASSVHMNPVLLKPQSQIGSQVIVQGKMQGSVKARDYFSMKPKLLEAVMASFERVSQDADLVLVEGAGSPAEINLRQGDIANMGFAAKACVPVVLIGDIDRGGVIASLVGSHTILPEDDRSLIAGYLINKFRGDITLFDEGLEAITGFTGWRSYGVLPWLEAVRRLPAEDSLALEKMTAPGDNGKIVIAVPILSKIANFDDLDPLLAEDGVSVVFVRKGKRIPAKAALIILPGSKSTIADMIELRENGWDQDIADHVHRGGEVIGICGGYQMLGRTISDPDGIEGDIQQIDGLGLLEVETVLAGQKITRNTRPVLSETGQALEGYEIHVGRTSGADCARPMINSENGMDGAISTNGKVQGCYLHGLFGADQYRTSLVRRLGAVSGGISHYQLVEDVLNELAGHMEKHLDVDGLLEMARIVRF
jgi:adenosylcobyric acid synthase